MGEGPGRLGSPRNWCGSPLGQILATPSPVPTPLDPRLLVFAYEQGNFGSLISNLPIKITCDIELDLQGQGKVMSGQVRLICLFSSFK